MINSINGSKWGVKDSTTNLTNDIHEIIDNSNDYIIVCGYNFSPFHNPTSIIPKLIDRVNNGVKVLVILPASLWGFGNTNHSINIQHMLNNGIGVIVNSNNHSKWMVSDYGYYYGSLNFTKISMTTRIEVVTICNVLNQATIPRWMEQTKSEFLRFGFIELYRFDAKTINLGRINVNTLNTLRSFFSKILKFNPEIKKVKITLENYEEVRTKILTIIEDYYAVISFEDLNKIWEKVSKTIFYLDKLAMKGNEILISNDNDKYQLTFDVLITEYNRIFKIFEKIIHDFMNFIKFEKFAKNKNENIFQINNKLFERLKELGFNNDNE